MRGQILGEASGRMPGELGWTLIVSGGGGVLSAFLSKGLMIGYQLAVGIRP